MAFLSLLKIFLKVFGIFPHRNINLHGICNTVHMLLITFLFFAVAIPAGAKCYVDGTGQDLNTLIMNLQTTLNFSLFAISYPLLFSKSIKLNDLICDMERVVEQRKKRKVWSCIGIAVIALYSFVQVRREITIRALATMRKLKNGPTHSWKHILAVAASIWVYHCCPFSKQSMTTAQALTHSILGTLPFRRSKYRTLWILRKS